MERFGDHWLDVLGWGGSALLVLSLLQTRVLRFRALNLVACLILLCFNALIEVWPMVGMNVVLAAINVWFLVRLTRDRHDDEVFEVVQVKVDDEYFRHVLKTHEQDIRAFQPDFGTRPDAGQLAVVVVTGDETVGVVLLRTDGDAALVELDYVTPRYRDFSPGEFVWRRSGVLRDLGLRRVTTSPQMRGAYYEHVGFRRDGEEFVLEL
ncbi:YgjV family protein [Nocardioides sp. 503]|uniref:YgjV family protein n=1 Tax=Nocardioides sp. 503 TaxID=2508326 RepID=UPI00106FD6CD|nr:YgjV family protein [Nocardioides sp. 503]